MTEIPGDEAKTRLQGMGDYQFEEFIADLWEATGWNTEVTAKSGDRGIDIIATRYDPVLQRQILQVKRYGEENKVGSRAIRQYGSLYQQENNIDAVIVVTSSYFTREAKRIARKLDVTLVDVDEIYSIIESYDQFDLLHQYSENTGSGGEIFESKISAEEKREKIKKMYDLQKKKIDADDRWDPFIDINFLQEDLIATPPFYQFGGNRHLLINISPEMADSMEKIIDETRLELENKEAIEESIAITGKSRELSKTVYTDFHFSITERVITEVFNISFEEIRDVRMRNGGEISWKEI